jgi:hypothetical protein
MKLYKTHSISWVFPDDDTKGDLKIKVEDMKISDRIESYIPDIALNIDRRGYRNDSNLMDEISKGLQDGRVSDFSGVKTMYRYPKLNLSRDKVSLYCEENDMKVIRDPNKADVRILSVGIMKSVITETWYNNFLTRDKFIEIMKSYGSAFEDVNAVIEKLKDTYDEDSFITCARQYYHRPDCWDKYVGPFLNTIDEGKQMTTCNVIIEPKNLKTFNELFTGNFTWIMDEDANKVMSADSVTLDDEMYVQLKDMIKSGNGDDITVAMTTLANCNIETSKTYIAILFFHFFEFFKGTNTFNTVNFKSLRKAFQKYYDRTSYNHGHANRYETLIRLLTEDNALTVNAMEHILDLVFEKVVLNATGLSSSKEVFTIKRSSISLTPEFASQAKSLGFQEALKKEAMDGLPF